MLTALAFLEEGVVGLAQPLDVDHLVVVHAHGGQGIGHLLLSEATHKMSGQAGKEDSSEGGDSHSCVSVSVSVCVCVCVCECLFACVCAC